VNGTEVARRDFDFPIDLGSRQWMATIGADSSGRNSGALMLAEIGVFSMTFTDAELKKSPKTPYNSIRQNDEINIHRSPLQKYPHYRVNRVDHRRCWFVSSQGGSGHSRPRRTTSVGRRHFVSRSRHEVPHVQYDREVNPEMASAQMAPPDAALPLEQAPLPDFAARWPDLPSSQDLGPRKVATISYTRPTTNAPTLPTPSVGAKRAVEQSSAGEAFNSVFFGGALTATLLVAGGVSYFARRRRRTPRDERHATTEGPDQATHMFARSDRLTGNKWPVQTRHHASDRQTSPPTVPADDPETGLRDPTFDLRRSFFLGHLSRVRKVAGF
jgi:hypothetical protein